VCVAQMDEQFVNQIHDLRDPVFVLAVLDLEEDRDISSAVSADCFRPLTINATVLWQFDVVTPLHEALQPGIHPGSGRDIGKEMLESEHLALCVDREIHLTASQPDELKSALSLPGLDLAEAAKDPAISIRLEGDPDCL